MMVPCKENTIYCTITHPWHYHTMCKKLLAGDTKTFSSFRNGRQRTHTFSIGSWFVNGATPLFYGSELAPTESSDPP